MAHLTRLIPGVNDLATANPALAAEWHPTKNGDLTPDMVAACSAKKVWWQCSKGHEWEATANSRSRGIGCPYCYGRFPIPGKTDLMTLNPTVAQEWDYEKNAPLTPDKVCTHSNYKAWWKCKRGHSWQSVVSVRQKHGCPYCSGQKTLPGFNDLATTHPALAAEWHPTKNSPLTPQDVVVGSQRKVWWQCEKGHEWQAVVRLRRDGHGCPYCSGRLPIPGETDLATVNPELAKEWHPTKNGALTPQMVKARSGRKVWWQCRHGHEWEALVSTRSEGSGCPFCSNKAVLPGFNDLSTTNPQLAAEWHTTKNGDLTPQMVTAGSNKKAWWQCSKGHEWVAVINGRSSGFACPYCNKRLTVSGENDLLTMRPDIAAQWHPTKNGSLTPDMVSYSSRKTVWWQCEHGHEWTSRIGNRTLLNRGCPYCYGRYAISGKNDLETVNPTLTAEWHPVKNGDLTPKDVTAGSNKKAWWKCSACGYEWKSVISHRSNGVGCPICAKKTPYHKKYTH